jgi:hypothetical protein
MNPKPSDAPRTESTSLQVAGGTTSIAFSLWSIMCNAVKPWNCKQAQAVLQEACSDTKNAGADANLELREQLLDVKEPLLEIREENLDLKEENASLKKKLVELRSAE